MAYDLLTVGPRRKKGKSDSPADPATFASGLLCSSICLLTALGYQNLMIRWRQQALEGAAGLSLPCHCLETRQGFASRPRTKSLRCSFPSG